MSKKKIKAPNQNDKVSAKTDQFKCNVKDDFSFSLKYITNNNHYNFRYIESNIVEFQSIKSNIYEDFLKKVSELSMYSFKELLLERKRNGIEVLTYGDLNFKLSNTNEEYLSLSKDSSIYVFRFGKNSKGNNRAIFYKDSKCQPIMHILGFDFDYTAYNHGTY